MIPQMRPNAGERVAAATFNGVMYPKNASMLVKQAYHDGFAACFAMLREPSDEIIDAIRAPLRAVWRTEQLRVADVLRAAADAIEGEVSSPLLPLPPGR